MKNVKLLLTCILSCFLYYGGLSQKQNPNFDSTLAKRLDADDYGMKGYVFVMLKTGDNSTAEKTFADSCFRGHMENINRLASEGKLIVAGPFGKNDKLYRGLFILTAKNFEEAKAWLKADPAIESDILKAELFNWYGSAALSEYLLASDKIWKIKP